MLSSMRRMATKRPVSELSGVYNPTAASPWANAGFVTK